MESKKHAIVLGASMSGLMAARVLADHFQHVTVLDRDQLPDDAAAISGATRRGVPQSKHAHGLLHSGRAALEQLFPGVGAELQTRGAVEIAVGKDLCFFNEGQPLAPVESELRTLLLSRTLLETHVRGRVRARSNVTLKAGCEAVDLLTDGRTVRGVEVKMREATEGTQTLAADLVVDATGRGSRMGAWLHNLGFEAAAEERVRIDLGYTSCVYRRRPSQANGYKGLVAAVAPPNRRSGVALALEDDRWIVTLVGYLGESAEPTQAGMREFARGLATPAIYELLCDAEPVSEPVCMRFPCSQRRHYEQLRDFPDGLLAIGDTLCSFNPAFGQGMSVAACEALLLQRGLERGTNVLWKDLFRDCARLIDTPWSIAVGADLAFPEVVGERNVIGQLLGKYVTQLRRGAVRDPQLAAAFLRVVQLVDAPSALLAPALVLRTLRTLRAVEPRERESLQPEAGPRWA